MYSERIARVRKNLAAFNINGFLITDGDNLKYLTGFYGGTGDGVLLIGPDQTALITDARYETDFRDHLPEGVELLITRDYYGVAMLVAKRYKINNLGFEESLPFRIFDFLDETFEGVDADSDIVPVPELVGWLRQVKDANELAALRRAAQVSVDAYNEMLPMLHAGMTEREIANLLDRLVKARGAEKASFDTIVASGVRGALPHGEATDKKIMPGELVTVDFGYFVDGYTSDITRTFAVGQIDDESRKIYDIVKTANEKAISVIKAGISGTSIDEAAREIIADAGYGKEFNHSTGHGVGLAIHEGPAVSANSDDQIEAGMLLTIEPGIYVPNHVGVRIEDDIIVTADGFENLTAGITKDLVVIN
ncbi:aminopeptidase P family protein [Weissella diestrammenae]|uniref:Aminopeptidase P family protein n=1 Tax=Weissella diestrammenae TaxID=1162633 RepID=A0A7G9T3Y0_9LACO|nr:Xaa-Pro peptidase family protein [Weissella diestrammenae]MCM0583001.1 aminopeptidase P family protein [Weissella diestrammenae]QNN74805.1 aminopeptidase P family protein [Weissella diestrammenae]